MKKSIKKSGLV